MKNYFIMAYFILGAGPVFLQAKHGTPGSLPSWRTSPPVTHRLMPATAAEQDHAYPGGSGEEDLFAPADTTGMPHRTGLTFGLGTNSLDNTSLTTGRFSTAHLNYPGLSAAVEWRYLPWSSVKATYHLSRLSPGVLQQGEVLDSTKFYHAFGVTNPLTHFASKDFRSSVVAGPVFIRVGDGELGYNTVVSFMAGLENRLRVSGNWGATLGIYYLRHPKDEWLGLSHGQISLYLDNDGSNHPSVNVWRSIGNALSGLFRSGNRDTEGGVAE